MYKIDPKESGRKLRKLRGEKEQRTVADAVGVSVSALSMYENGDRMPRDDIKIAFAVYFNTTVEALFFCN